MGGSFRGRRLGRERGVTFQTVGLEIGRGNRTRRGTSPMKPRWEVLRKTKKKEDIKRVRYGDNIHHPGGQLSL